MKIENNASATGGIGFFGLLTIVLLVLKLTKVISISWVWVFAPIWGSVILVIGILIISFVGSLLFYHKKK